MEKTAVSFPTRKGTSYLSGFRLRDADSLDRIWCKIFSSVVSGRNGSWCDAGVPAVNNTRSKGSRSRNLHLCEQDYHKLLEFFFFDSVPPGRSSSLAGARPVKAAPGLFSHL